MTIMKKISYLFASLLFAAGTTVFTACTKDDCSCDDDSTLVAGIPSDKDATPNPIVDQDDINTVLPNLNYTVTTESGHSVIRLDFTGVRDPYTKDWLRLYGTDSNKQNIWISIDNIAKGFTVVNTIDEGGQKKSAVDLVFLVDNSSSMSEEANRIYNDIVEWADELSRTLDIRFGCIGYGGFVSGAINLTTATQLRSWLEAKDWMTNVDGIWRTRGFVGSDAERLYQASLIGYRVVGSSYVYTGIYHPDASECGVVGLRFANDLFSWRSGANRVYVNITDEPNQPNGNSDYSTQWVKQYWTATQGTIHTVYTQRSSWAETYMNYVDKDYPWDLSLYTDGTMLFTNSNFRDNDGNDIRLSDLPVSGALQNSYIIRFTNVESLFDNQYHQVHITVRSNSANGEIIADKTFSVLFTK